MRSVVIPVLLTLLTACHSDLQMQDGVDEYLKIKSYPSDHFFFQRAYPDTVLDMTALRKEILEWQSHEKINFNRRKTGLWTSEGPANTGARINTIAVDPNNAGTIYIGYSGGGAYKTSNGGLTWKPIFDDFPFLAIGHIVISQNNDDHLLMGTGDPNISGYPFIGNGVYQSTDGGDSWFSLGLEEVGIVSKTLYDPDDPDIIWISSMGIPFLRDTNRGVYKTTNAGNTWDQVLFLGMGTGVIDMVMHPEDRNVLYAAGWDRIRNYNESTTFGLGAKIYKTEDGGGTWKMMQDGLPTDTLSRIGLSISESDPSTICALFVNKEHDLEGVYRSIDGGQSWSEIPTGDDTGLSSGVLGGFGWYFGKVRIDPTDPELIYILGVDLWKWIADDEEWKRVGPNWWTGEVHADKHDLKFFGPDSMLLATDGGLYLSGDRGDTWSDIENIATTQFYRVAYNPHQPDRFFGGAQDNGTVDGNSLVINDWHTIFGGDGFRLLFHPEDPLTFYVETQRGGFAVTTDGGGTYQSAVTGVEATDNRNWDLPIIMSNHNPDVLYYGTDKVYRSSTGPEVEFKAISPVLTDSIVLLDLTSNLSALSESSLDSQLLFAGTGDGNVWRSRDYGSVWHMVSENLPDRYVTSVHQSEIDLNRVFVTHSGYKAGIDLPHIHVSEDLGEAWSDITGDLPPFAVNDLLVLPNNEDQVLFAGTDAGVYFTSDGGEHWERLGENMPYIPVYDLEYNPVLDRIIAGSYGKSIFTFDITQVGISGNPTVAVVEPANNGIMIYPNPTTDLVRIDPSQSSPVQLVSYKIYNTSGLALSGGAFPGTSVLSVGKWPSGTYLLVLRDKTNRLYQQRIIKW